MLPKIFFVPSYLGSLKYLERVATPLRGAHKIGFVVIQPEEDKRREMIAYCRGKGLLFFDLTTDSNVKTKVRLPFFSPLKKRCVHSRECRKFLERERPIKVIATKAIYPHDTILKEANKLGVETIVLRWSFSADGLDKVERSKLSHRNKREHTTALFLKRTYYSILNILVFVLDIPFKEPKYGVTPAVPVKIGVFTVKEARILTSSYDKEKLSVISSIDIQSGYELKKKINSDPAYREALLKKYGLASHKIKIALIVYRFYVNRGESDLGMTREEHLAHYYDIIKILRDFFPPHEADIFLKLHPSEENIYESYGDLGVKIFGDESYIEELVCLSDLYIASPQTNVNYLVLGSNVPSLFINFSLRPHLESYAENFFIQHVITEKGDFRERVQQFKEGKLENQYDNSMVDLRSLDKTVKFILGGTLTKKP